MTHHLQAAYVLTLLGAISCLLVTSACAKLPRRYALTANEKRQNAQDALQETTASVTLININTASSDELEKLPGIGHALAARIVAHRERFGRFRRVEHLLMVRGISDQRFREMRPFLTVE